MEVTIPLSTRDEALALFGLGDRNLKILRDSLGVRVTARGNIVRLQGERSPLASRVLNTVLSSHRSGATLPDDFVSTEVARLCRLEGVDLVAPTPGRPAEESRGGDGVSAEVPDVAAARGDVSPAGAGQRPLAAGERALIHSLARSPGQARYLEAMLLNEIVFAGGPAGTGKTFLAVNVAVHYLRQGAINKLILCRPAVEAGEKLGFLPGDFYAKINPYLRPLYDALNDVLGYEQVKRYSEREIIEIVPLAYMRGRTLNDAFIILDEGQNTSISQMKMFLTRMGAGSRIVVNGDITQVDLPQGQVSGLVHAKKIIRDIKGIQWAWLSRPDIVRHPLVQRIVEAYEGESGSGSGAEPESPSD